MMNDDLTKRPSDADTEPEQPTNATPSPPQTTPPRDTVETMSLLDLMADTADPDPPTFTSPRPLIVTDDDLTTGTHHAPTAARPAPPRPVGLPLSPEELTPPRERPLENDEDATTVQPRVAFPGSTNQKLPTPFANAPTQRYQPPAVTQPGADPAPTRLPPSQQPPVRATQGHTAPPTGQQQPQRQHPQQQPQYPQPQRQQPQSQQPAWQQPTSALPPARVAMHGQQPPPPHPETRRMRSQRGCFIRLLVISIILGMIGFALAVAGAAIGYSLIARDLPSPQELRQNASTFETARIYDRNSALLYSLADPNTGNRTYVPLERISPHLINATIATEDSRFYENPGFDPISIARAVLEAAREREFVSGASTITQQLVRALLLSEDERTERTFRRKVREIILAAEIARTYEKNEILELYLNEIYYGNLAYGIEAAAQTYFNKSAADLTLTEASLLAGLPQAPAWWDPYTSPDKALGRQWEVLTLMVQDGYATLDEAQTALNETNLFIYNLTPPRVTIRYPHFTFTVLQQAEEILGAQAIYRGGLNIFTTIDPAAQTLAEQAVTEQRGNLNAAGANNAAMVVLQPQTGEILAMVGSADFNDELISGQVNMALQARQPGSSIKPFVYLTAMERGWTPATLIWDVQTQFPDGTNPPYVPKNFDDEFHGPMLLRTALGNSYNIPAVKAMEFVGVCNFIANAQKLGLTALQDDGCAEVAQPRNYGLALGLGGGEIPPLQMAAAFAILANQGSYQTPYAIARIENNRGESLFAHTPTTPEAAQVVNPDHAYLLSHILADNNARQPEFGVNNNLVIAGHQVAAKTGTSGSSSSDVRDGWTIGYTPQVVTAVWIGNTDNTPIGAGQSGYRVASPIWNSFMTRYLADKQVVNFTRPPGVAEMEICADSGVQASAACGSRRVEFFANGQPPLGTGNHFLQTMAVDVWTGLQATEFCLEAVAEASFVNLLVSGGDNVRTREVENARQWLEGTNSGQTWAAARSIGLPLRLPPTEACNAETPRPQIMVAQPAEGSEITGIVDILGTVNGPNFSGYQVEYGFSHDPGGWGMVQERQGGAVENGRLATWDTININTFGAVTLRIIIFGPDNPYTPEDDPATLEKRVYLTLLQPTPTPTPTATATVPATETPTPTPTITPSPTATAIATILPTITPLPSMTPSPTIELPTATPEPTSYP